MNNRNLPFILLAATLVILNIIVFYYNNVLGVITALISIFALGQIYADEKKAQEEQIEELQNLDKYFDDITRSAVFSLPYPTTILNEAGEIIWYNTKFKDLVGEDRIKSVNIEAFIPELEIARMLDKKSAYIDSKINNKYYTFYYTVVDTYDQKDQNIILLYARDNTDFEEVKNKRDQERLIAMMLEVDNYSEIRSSLDETIRPVIFGEIDKIINTFATKYNGFARKYENDKYLLIFDKKNYEKMKKDGFTFVEELENLGAKETIRATISAGVGSNKNSPLEIYKTARLALDVAQGRGGDQIVENNGDNLQYYGGKEGAVDKRTKVKSRIIANATVQLIEQLQDVFIMGHKNPDMDSFGSCLGMYALVKSLGANGKIVLKEVTPQISSLYKETVGSVEGLEDDIISPDQAVAMASENSLVILVDNHNALQAEAPELFEITSNLILIDHHRRGENFVESPTLTYLEPYASSASELVTEIIQYTDGVELPKTIAEGLLAGIKVDTKSFTFQTGVRTFEAASFLQKEGADAIRVNMLFDEPAETVKNVAKVVSNSEVYCDKISISVFDEQGDDSVLIAAKAADEMLKMKGIQATFVLTQLEDAVHISGRSSGKISVQIILERLGGGGHQTAAATQLKDINMEIALEKLKEEIDKYLEEEK